MDKTHSLPHSAHLLDDLESIRQLLGDDTLQPPLLTETVHNDAPIPLLFELADTPPTATEPVASLAQAAEQPDRAPAAATTAAHTAHAESLAPVAAPAPDAAQLERNRQDTLLHLDAELRAAAQLIMQDVIDDFAPHIETEIKRRLEARMERLLGN